MSTASHIAVFCIPASGHVHPTLPIVSELVGRGHRVSYATTADFAPRVAGTGATPVVCASALPSMTRGESYPHDDAVAMYDLFLQEAVTSLPDQSAAFEADRPDVILYDYASFNAQILVRRWGIPSVRTSPTHVSGPDFADELDLVNFALEQNPAWEAHRRAFRQFLDAGGIDLGIDEAIYRGRADRYLATIPREIQRDAGRLDDRYTFVGPCIDERPHDGRWERPADGRPVLLVSMGSVRAVETGFYELCQRAFGGSRWRVVLVAGAAADLSAFGELPDGFEVHRSVPQLSVLAQSACFVTHAGMGSVLEGLYYGVPMVALPQGFDGFDNAAALDRLGVGVTLGFDDLTAPRLRAAVDGLADDPAVAGRLAALRTAMREAGGARAAADVVEQCLDGSALVRSAAAT
jgi:MGT family glycosyltransferase